MNFVAEASEVFYDLIKGSNSSELKIVNVEPDCLSQMVNFLYSNEIEDKEVLNVKELLLAASKYKMDRLLKTCEKILYDKVVKEEDFLSILLFANQYEIEELENEVIKFVAK